MGEAHKEHAESQESMWANGRSPSRRKERDQKADQKAETASVSVATASPKAEKAKAATVATASPKASTMDEQLQAAFNLIDTNSDGRLSHEEMLHAIRTKPEIRKILGLEAPGSPESSGKGMSWDQFSAMHSPQNKPSYHPSAASSASPTKPKHMKPKPVVNTKRPAASPHVQATAAGLATERAELQAQRAVKLDAEAAADARALARREAEVLAEAEQAARNVVKRHLAERSTSPQVLLTIQSLYTHYILSIHSLIARCMLCTH